MNKKLNSKKTIGRKDKADFPRMRLYDIDVKIDTGAYTSAINCQNIKVIEKDGTKYVSFNLLDPTHPDYSEKKYRMLLYSKKKIKNSFGKSEERCIIKTTIKLFEKNFEIELSLSDRSNMD
ncbi:MAG: RimK/LysX family protein, partial [Thermodesulfobacteriota bacterium]